VAGAAKGLTAMRVYDISLPLEPATAPFPGDAPFALEWTLRFDRGDSCNVGAIRLSSHLGTHADAPLHYDPAGADVASLELGPYLGRCRVLDVRGAGALVPADRLGAGLLRGVERALLRTRDAADHRRFDPAFPALAPDAARALVAAGVRLVGIDTPSVDPVDAAELPAHQVLRAGDVRILENLVLAHVPAGDYELIALPLCIVGGDGSPVRAVLRELPAPPSP
jgi:arylformamidase